MKMSRRRSDNVVNMPSGEGTVAVAPDSLLDRIRAEYVEMPGMTLRLEQVARLCGIEQSICKVVLDGLVEVKFLCVTPDGAYARPSPDTMLRARAAKADFESSRSSRVHRRAG